MFSDVVGYTAIMGRDENEALRALDAHRALLRSLMPKFNGRMVGEIGDGTLTAFHSAIDAVNCAREVQANLQDNPELKVRIGIHLGDVMFSNNTVLGDGVNVASRIHALAPPGGICVSANVFDEIRNKPGTSFKDLGRRRLKNVTRSIRVYQLVAGDRLMHPAEESASRRRNAIIAGATAAMVAVLTILFMRTRSPARAPAPPSTPGAAQHAISSIAVLPLDNFSGDPNQEYFADGMTEELTTDLAKISALRVISRSSVMQFKGAHRPTTPEIAKLLNVDAVVEGSVARIGDRVRVTAQLIDAPADKHLWADTYERDSQDVLALQDEVALAIAREINVELTPHEQARFADARTVSPQAYEAYLKGRYFMSSPTEDRSSKAVGQFELAIKADSNFAPAYSGLSDAYCWVEFSVPPREVMPKAKAAAEKALQLDDSLAEAHASLACVKWGYEFDWVGGERELRRAIELNPSYAYAHNQYGELLAWQGRFDESLAEMRRATELDPLSVLFTADVANPLEQQGRYGAAKEQIRKALELDPNDAYAQGFLGYIDIAAGKFNEAIPVLEKLQAMNPSGPPCDLGYAYAAAGERAQARAALKEVNQISLRQYVSATCPAQIYAGLGDKRRALDELDKAYEDRSGQLITLKVSKAFDPLRSEPRFIALLKKVGLDK
jgi:adenylate cyclase